MYSTTVALIIGILLFLPDAMHSQGIEEQPDSIHIRSNTLRKAVIFTSAYYAGSMIILSQTWYKDRKVVPFHFYDDTKGYLQVDKFGHMFGAYVYSYIGYHYLLNAGYTKKESLYFGATLGAVMQAPIEIMDGIHEGYGFSWGDVAANTLGSALVVGQELLFDEQIVKYKFSYRGSSYAEKANGYLGKTTLDRLLKDYNGHTYWFSIPAGRMWKSNHIPSWLNVALGYGANGMYGEFENISMHNGVEIPETRRYRQYLFSLDIDWTKIETDSRFLEIVLKGMTFIKLPFPALEYNSMGEFKWYWLYF